MDKHKLFLNGLGSSRRIREGGFLASGRPGKRQRTENLNSQYDNMIHAVNAMHQTSTRTSRSRQRPRVASSSSTATLDIPKTPTDAYSHYSLNQDCPRSQERRRSRNSFNAPEAFKMETDGNLPIPEWLRGTIYALDPQNPLRLLLPDDPDAYEGSSHNDCDPFSDLISISNKDERFVSFIPDNDIASATASSSPTPRLSAIPASFAFAKGIKSQKLTLHNRGAHNCHFEHSGLPFSTPGPIAPSLLSVSTAHARPHPNISFPLYPDSVSSSPAVAKGVASSFKPYSKPGPNRLTDSVDALALSRSPLAHDLTTPVSQRLLPPKGFLPFSTPGPSSSSLGLLCTALRSNSPSDTEPTLSFTDRSPLGEPTPELLYSRLASRQSRHMQSSPEPQSQYVEQSQFAFHSEYNNLRVSPLPESSDHPASARTGISALDFKWERFDRGRIAADFSASSPHQGHLNSEEAFWGPPARRIGTPFLSPAQDTVWGNISVSSHLSGIPTPVVSSPVIADHQRSNWRNLERKEEDDGPFAWIVQPRDSPQPSTPRASMADIHRAMARITPQRQANERCSPAVILTSPRSRQQRNVAHSDGPEKMEEALSAPQSSRQVAFAPGPNIYISPLQDRSDTNRKEGVGNGKSDCGKSEVLVSHDPVKTAPPPRTGGVDSTLAASPGLALGEGGGTGARAGASQSLSGDSNGAAGSLREPDDDIETEEEGSSLQHCSQESKDSIESWTNYL